LDDSVFFSQTNFYFDTSSLDLLRQSNMVLRIRLIPPHYQATLKVPHPDHLVEINYSLDYFDQMNFPFHQTPDIVHQLRQHSFDPATIHRQGTLVTKRAQIPYLNGELFLDISQYDNQEDYEVEYEVTSSLQEAEKIIIDLFQQLGIQDYRPSTAKVRRCLEKNARIT
jgi:uncharacterized protein YjbK